MTRFNDATPPTDTPLRTPPSPAVGTPDPRAASATHLQSLLQVPTMTCGSCIQRVKGALQNVDGVLEVRARVDLRQVTVLHDPQRADEGRLREALQRAGYPAA